MTAAIGPVLVLGATGFLGQRVVTALQADGREVRALVRRPDRAGTLTAAGVQICPGDMLDAAAVHRAVGDPDSVDGNTPASAVIVCVHTLSQQSRRGKGADFMDVESAGLQHVIDACRAAGVTRLLYVTAIGVSADAVSSWQRGRWHTEQLLFGSGLDATVVRPGMIVGHGGDGFGIIERGARGRVAFVIAARSQRFRTIAVDDLAAQLVALLDIPASYGSAYDTGSDDVHTMDEMIELAAAHLGRRPPRTLHLPRRILGALSPIIERAARMPPGALSGLVGPGSDADMVGNPAPIRALDVPSARPFGDALEQALDRNHTSSLA